ncbi:MAG: KTSC domain-containing protein [Allosphingosinicella sp.]
MGRLRVHDFESSAIARAAYDDEAATLDIWYKGGDRYRYFDVPAERFEALLAAPSAGEYVNRHVKDSYRFEIGARRKRFRPD